VLTFLPEVVADGDRIGGDAFVRRDQINVRRLSEHAYWIEVRGYQTTVLVGEESAMLMDPLSGGRGSQVRSLVHELFGLDVSAIAYTHHHGDHNADAASFTTGRPVEILASEPCADRIQADGAYPLPTTILADRDSFLFEDVEVEVRVVGGHSTDLTWFRIPDEGVLHMIDTIHPGQAEFESFAMAPDLRDYARAVELALDTPWRVLTAGHGELGWRQDVDIVDVYLKELRETTEAALRASSFESFVEPATQRYTWLARHQAHVIDEVVAAMSPRWSHLPGYAEVARSHAHRMQYEVQFVV
jgi:glyoxylase-like metal-dependent hydrolase (beta-lactamase superfamily II)